MLMRHTVHRRSGETFNRGEEREGRKGGFPDSHGWLVDCGGIAFLPNLSKKSESLLRIQNKVSVAPAACFEE